MSKPTGSARVLAGVKRSVLRGELLPGEQLRQERLAAEFEVSRVPLREALLILANQGLLKHEPNQGFVVAKRSEDEIGQLHHLLSLLEGELLRTITWPGAATISRMKALNEAMSALVDSPDWVEIIELNHEFHRSLWQCSRLNLFADEVERVWPLADPYIGRAYSRREDRARAVREHALIIESLEAHDEEMLLRTSADHRQSTIKGMAGEFGW
ncbi:GntR family transcriptional regulator [bacterium RCC_150]